jgi:PP-loop superfamily ATP-utilizing enzyme
MAIILFSGGCDSTLVLYNKAMEALKSGSLDRIKAISINHPQIINGPRLKIARDKIKTIFPSKLHLYQFRGKKR